MEVEDDLWKQRRQPPRDEQAPDPRLSGQLATNTEPAGSLPIREFTAGSGIERIPGLGSEGSGRLSSLLLFFRLTLFFC